ncbi:MAG: hypothetical protein V4632_06845 [Pseudomonadota bacterium]
MKMIPRSRLIAALLALVSMLFMQLALAGYVCPGATTGPGVESAVMSDMPDCQSMDMEQPSLCQAYGQAGNQSLDKPNLPQVQPFIPAALTLVLLAVKLTADISATVQPDAFLLTRATAPPLAIQHCCFRI